MSDQQGRRNHWRVETVDDMKRHWKSYMRMLRMRKITPKEANSFWAGLSVGIRLWDTSDTAKMFMDLQEEVVDLHRQLDAIKRKKVT